MISPSSYPSVILPLPKRISKIIQPPTFIFFLKKSAFPPFKREGADTMDTLHLAGVLAQTGMEY